MKKQMIFKLVCCIICFLSFLLLIGTIGAVENDSISLGKGILRLSIYFLIFTGAAYTGGFME